MSVALFSKTTNKLETRSACGGNEKASLGTGSCAPQMQSSGLKEVNIAFRTHSDRVS